jgi:hypothetical protein
MHSDEHEEAMIEARSWLGKRFKIDGSSGEGSGGDGDRSC